MPEDPIVNDHYGDILWKLDQKNSSKIFLVNGVRNGRCRTRIIDQIKIN